MASESDAQVDFTLLKPIASRLNYLKFYFAFFYKIK